MYAWIWRHLPGNLAVRVLISAALAFTVLAVLWMWVFPWADVHLPLDPAGFAG